MFTASIEYSKAFDKVNHNELWVYDGRDRLPAAFDWGSIKPLCRHHTINLNYGAQERDHDYNETRGSTGLSILHSLHLINNKKFFNGLTTPSFLEMFQNIR